MNTKEQIIARMSSFPTIPVIVHRLMKVLHEQESGVSAIGEVVRHDPALTANILKAANSSYLGFNKPVTSLTEASFRLGTKWIYQIAVSSLIYSNINRPADGYEQNGQDLWRHSVATAVLAEALSKLLNIKDSGLIFTAALVHDIGKIATQEFVGEAIEEIENLVTEKKMTFEEAEIEVLGVDHAEVGAMIADHWNFPPQIVECIRWHHNPDAAPEITPAMDVVHIADALSLMEGIGIGRDGMYYRPSKEAIVRLNATGSILELAVSQLLSSLEEIEGMLEETLPAHAETRR